MNLSFHLTEAFVASQILLSKANESIFQRNERVLGVLLLCTTFFNAGRWPIE